MIRTSLIGVAMAALATAVTAQTPTQAPNGRYRVVMPGVQARLKPPVVKPVVQPAAQPIAQQSLDALPPPPPAPERLPPPPVEPRPDIVVTTATGLLGGEKLWEDSHVFRAVPFARPPVGDLRWRAPQDPLSWQGVRYTKDSAPACLQVDLGWQSAMSQSSDEDCLYLEVRTPDTKAKLPVMVFIHGGANRAGGAAGTVMAGFASKGVVIVSIPYRLGALGFLSHPALTQEQGGASGNYALMDQVKALEWVRDNIAGFGGDPGNVTIFGHSAGAQDVGLLLTSPLAKGLFQKAISQSGPPQFGLPARSLAQNEAIGVELARRYSMNAPESAAALADLRRQPAMALQIQADQIPPPVEDASFIWLQAIVDGKVLPRAPEDVFRSGEAARVPLIIGVSARELGLHGGPDNIYKAVFKAFGEGRFKAMSFYRIDKGKPPKADPLLGDTAMQISTDIMMRCPADWTAAQMTRAGNSAFLYHLGVDKDGKVHHGSELDFVMNPRPDGQGDETWPPLLDYWVNFAKTGDPNAPGLPRWPVYGDDRSYIDFTTKGPYARTELRGPVCSLLDRP
ncbi:carboxylesterase/lipase family protein [Asticcacaulis sp. AC402]|uniref:carboxylesterase/lipase family protein n=1 Tax=Asticcacaulis sp. AC402 TaxID=1282361 RepID=UPI0003C412DA|nr:carboxylesterase family protein [Asticcacaulis sp. AC402]ESQ75540.1 hypothetical protein ABAC402_08420 [Asticcacaulis sp. AC402]